MDQIPPNAPLWRDIWKVPKRHAQTLENTIGFLYYKYATLILFYLSEYYLYIHILI